LTPVSTLLGFVVQILRYLKLIVFPIVKIGIYPKNSGVNMVQQTYVVGIDGSEWSMRALKRAVIIAQDTKAKIQVLYVMDGAEYDGLSTEKMNNVQAKKQQEIDQIEQSIINPMIAPYADTRVCISAIVLMGTPAKAIHQHVKSHNASMVFVGRRGRSAMVNLVTGSTATKLAHSIGVPIVLVP